MPRAAEPTDAQLCERARAGDSAATDLLVLRHEAMCVNLAQKTGLGSEDQDDLVQEGRIGIALAAKKWNPDAGSKFSTYAFMAVRNQVLKAVAVLRAQGRDRTDLDLNKFTAPEPAGAVAGEPGEPSPFAEAWALLTPLERGLVELVYGLHGPAVGHHAAGKRFKLTGPAVREILTSAFLRVRKQAAEEE